MDRRRDGMAMMMVAQKELQSGERLVWAERPGPAARARTKLMLSLFGIPFLVFAIFWEVQAVAGAEAGAGSLFPLFGIPFILVGIGLILSPLWSYVEARNWLFYAITDRRMLIIRQFPMRKVESFRPQDITKCERTEKSDGSGNIVFRDDLKSGSRGSSYTVPRGFFGIPDVRRVEEQVMKLRDSDGDSR